MEVYGPLKTCVSLYHVRIVREEDKKWYLPSPYVRRRGQEFKNTIGTKNWILKNSDTSSGDLMHLWTAKTEEILVICIPLLRINPYDTTERTACAL